MDAYQLHSNIVKSQPHFRKPTPVLPELIHLRQSLILTKLTPENKKNINHAFFIFSEKSKNINFVKVVTNY
jgi:hypothetical protein